ncbi:hypothetical protein PRIO_0211 [Paenibacillus riograndensis SBR5]|uniref:Uncharacterized protein n=1 Tax=Paenibacillus riograndensis SBR5 TaxID=1073571 RepID=A0A0E4H773_9BACL|nr:hypothetical protein PRIO_0211 [Paenibacillus riograndensis SBR5]
MSPDPFFQDIPWEFITDDSGKVIGEVFLTLPDPPLRKRQLKWGTTTAKGVHQLCQ